MINKARHFKKNISLAVGLLLFSANIFGQTITHPSSGTSSSTITCGTTYNYYDPGGVGNYGNNQLGTLTLNPSIGGQYVQIDFTTGPFDIEPNGGGCYDWIEIYDGPNTLSPLIGTYCNSTIPTTITSSTGSLTIVFDSDGTTIRSGWDADVSCSIAPGPPPPLVHPSSGSSSSTITCGATSTYLDPGGTGNYSNNQLGTMTFNPSIGGLYVQIDFTTGAFDVEVCGGAACTCDWIQVYDGVNTGAPLIGRYCNGNVPGIIISSTGSLTVVFDSDGGAVGSGWVAEVSCSPTPGPPPPFVHPSSGTSSATIICGTTYDYYDPGGAAGNYSNNQTGILTFNPSAAGQMIQ
ncbi:MAG: hypothetical protein JKX68_04130 [Flavobacteriales bacterium]|nr:hypothetical protein [Flavobacteriales bacterium]